MAEYVKDAILLNEFTDLTLLRLVELTITSIQADRPLFAGLIAEPVFYRRHFREWVREALEEKARMEEAQAEDPLQR